MMKQERYFCVQKARNHEEWRLEYMTLLMRDQEMIRRGREEGRLQEIFCRYRKVIIR